MAISEVPSLVVYGDVNVEVLAQIDDLPRSGQDAIVEQLRILPGGSAANCAVVAAKLGSQVKFIGVTGEDMFDPFLRNDLKRAGVDIQHLKQLDGSTSIVITMVDRKGERTFLSYRGAAADQDYGHISNSLLQPGDIIHISGYSFQTAGSRILAERLIAIAHHTGAKIAIDPSYHFARQLGKGDYGILHGVDYLFPNEEEAMLITKSNNGEQAAKRLIRLGVKTVLLKLGDKGCLAATQSSLIELPAFPVSPMVDSTGAGDGFAGGFLAATMQGCSLVEAAAVGQAAAAVIISEVGGHEAAPTLKQLREFAFQRNNEPLSKGLERMHLGKRE